MEHEDRIKVHNFEGATTYTNDFRIPKSSERVIHKWRKEAKDRPYRKERRGSIEVYKPECHETFTKYKEGASVPFNILWPMYGSIVNAPPPNRTIPQEVVDANKEEVIKTRPRRYISPAASIDDVTDSKMKKLLLDYMYTTEFRNAEKEATSYILNKKKQKNEEFCATQNIPKTEYDFMVSDGPRPYEKYQPNIHPEVPSGWRSHFDQWDLQQRRACVDPTATFWINKDPPVKCGACENPLQGLVPKEKTEEIRKLIEKNEMRMPHDKVVQWYAGYRPWMARGVPLKAKKFPVAHPQMTTAQAITARYAEDSKK